MGLNPILHPGRAIWTLDAHWVLLFPIYLIPNCPNLTHREIWELLHVYFMILPNYSLPKNIMPKSWFPNYSLPKSSKVKIFLAGLLEKFALNKNCLRTIFAFFIMAIFWQQAPKLPKIDSDYAISKKPRFFFYFRPPIDFFKYIPF